MIEVINPAFIREKLDNAIETAQREYKSALNDALERSGRMTLTPEQHPRVQHAHGALNALADLRTELVAAGVIEA